MTAPGRNDPCPCGSGKKYKKCHLDADEATRRARNAAPTEPAAVAPATVPTAPNRAPPREPTPEELRWDAFWQRFDAASIDERLTLANEALTGGEALVGDDLTEIAAGLVEPLRVAGRWAEADALLDAMESSHPAAAAEAADWFRVWRAESALLRPDADRAAVRPTLLACAESVHLAELQRDLADRLRYHDRLDDLAVFANAVWSRARSSDKLLPWAIDEWRDTLALARIQQLLAADPARRPEDGRLREVLEPFGDELREEFIAMYVALDTGAREFSEPAGNLVAPGNRGDAALESLSVAFGRALRVEHGWPRGRADIAREQVLDLMLSRRGELLGQGEEQTRDRRGNRRAERGTHRTPAPAQLLIPGEDHLDRHLGKNLSMFVRRVSVVAAELAAMPAWLGFLAARGLVPAERVAPARKALAPLVETLAGTLARMDPDPSLPRDLRAAWATA